MYFIFCNSCIWYVFALYLKFKYVPNTYKIQEIQVFLVYFWVKSGKYMVNTIGQIHTKYVPNTRNMYLVCIQYVFGMYLVCIWYVFGMYLTLIVVFGMYLVCISFFEDHVFGTYFVKYVICLGKKSMIAYFVVNKKLFFCTKACTKACTH